MLHWRSSLLNFCSEANSCGKLEYHALASVEACVDWSAAASTYVSVQFGSEMDVNANSNQHRQGPCEGQADVGAAEPAPPAVAYHLHAVGAFTQG